MNDHNHLLMMTADIVASHVSHNTVSVNDLPTMIAGTYQALAACISPPAPEVAKPQPAVPVRGSIKPDHILSMIDGRPYKMLKRHLSLNGHTPESYRQTFGLPRDYPMVAANYAAKRRELALNIGLGRKR